MLKISRPSFKSSSLELLRRKDVFGFCSNILNAHCTNAFGGKLTLWDFLKDVAANITQAKQGYRWSLNSKAFAQTIKIYEGQRMCDLFQLNFVGLAYKTTKQSNKKV